MYSLIIPVYRNADSLVELLSELTQLASRLDREFKTTLEVVFVVDGSPDSSYQVLFERLPHAVFASKLLLHSRNFGSFAAIRSGLVAADGEYFGVMAADLQEPATLQEEFLSSMRKGECDVVVGTRASRDDPMLSRLASGIFWRLFRYLVNRDVPKSGVDVFGCTRQFRDQLLALEESNSSLVGLIYWLGFRRSEINYHRQARKHGKSAWSFRRKMAYMLDSVFSFTDLPVRILVSVGFAGLGVAVLGGAIILLTRLLVGIDAPGYAATMLTLLFFGALNALGLGIIGSYTWRAFENTKQRPLAVVMSQVSIPRSDVRNNKASETP